MTTAFDPTSTKKTTSFQEWENYQANDDLFQCGGEKLVFEESTGHIFRHEGQSSLASKSIVVFVATPFYVVGAMLWEVAKTVVCVAFATFYFLKGALQKCIGKQLTFWEVVILMGACGMLKSSVCKMMTLPFDGLITMGYALYGLYDGQAARSGMNKAWGDGYLLKQTGMQRVGNRQDQ